MNRRMKGNARSPQVTLTRPGENPRLAVTTSVARVRGFGLENLPDGVADEPVATSNEDDVWHSGVCGNADEGVEVVKVRSVDRRLYIIDNASRSHALFDLSLNLFFQAFAFI